MPKPRPPAPPSAVVLRGFLLASFLWFALPWLWSIATASGLACYHLTPAAAGPDLRSIRARLHSGHDRTMGRLFPEGELFSNSFYGFTLVNLAVANSDDRAFRAHALSELARLIPRTEALAARPPFAQCQSLTPRGGIIPAGHANLLRAGYALLGGDDPAILAAYHDQSQVLFDAFTASPVANLESYPNLIWPVDNIVALESLRLHDVLYGTAFSAACDRWARWMAAHLDPPTGMLVSQIDQTGQTLDAPRGCALSWMLAFLPNFAPDLARQQYALYREHWFRHPLGTAGIREFPPDRPRTFVDSDTGPIICGMGTAATGFGIAAAKANNDPENLTALLRALELCSFPAYGPNLSRSRFLGQALLPDELALWGQTLTRWDTPLSLRERMSATMPTGEGVLPPLPPGEGRGEGGSHSLSLNPGARDPRIQAGVTVLPGAVPTSAPVPSSPSAIRHPPSAISPPLPPPPLHHFWLVPVILSAATLLIAWLLLRSFRRAWRSCRQATGGVGHSRSHAIFLTVAALTVAAFLLVPFMNWLYALLVLAGLEVVEKRWFPKPIGIEITREVSAMADPNAKGRKP